MITTSNYFTTSAPYISFFDETLKAGHQFLLDLKDAEHNISESTGDADMDDIIKMQIEEVNKIANSQKKTTAVKKPRSKISAKKEVYTINKFKEGDSVIDNEGDTYKVDRVLKFNKRFNDYEYVLVTDGKTEFIELEKNLNLLKPKPTAPKKTVAKAKHSVKKELGMETEKVRTFDDDLKVVRYFVSIDGKNIAAKSLINKIKQIHKLNAEAKINKDNPHFELVNEIMQKLNKLYEIANNNTEKNVAVKIVDANLINKAKKIAKGISIYKSVALYKRYVNLFGNVPSKKTVDRFVKEIYNALIKGTVYGKDPYAHELNEIAGRLQNYDGKTPIQPVSFLSGTLGCNNYFCIECQQKKEIEAPKNESAKVYTRSKKSFTEAEALQDIEQSTGITLSGCKKCHNKYRWRFEADPMAINKSGFVNELSEYHPIVPTEEPIAEKINLSLGNVTNNEVYEDSNGLFSKLSEKTTMNNPYKIGGAVGEFIGTLDKTKLAITIMGEQGCGKTPLVFQIADESANVGLSVLLISCEMAKGSLAFEKYKEQNINKSNWDKINVYDQNPCSIDFIIEHGRSFDVVIIDSYGKLQPKPNPSDYDRLRSSLGESGTLLVTILQTRSDGEVRGGNAPQFDCDIEVRGFKGDSIKDSYFKCEKNRYGSTELTYNWLNRKVSVNK